MKEAATMESRQAEIEDRHIQIGGRKYGGFLPCSPKREARLSAALNHPFSFRLAETDTESRPPLGGSFARRKEGVTPLIGD